MSVKLSKDKCLLKTKKRVRELNREIIELNMELDDELNEKKNKMEEEILHIFYVVFGLTIWLILLSNIIKTLCY